MPDFGYKVPSTEGSEQEGDLEWEAWLQRSRSCVRRYLRSSCEDDEEMVQPKTAHKYRQATYWNLAALDHALRQQLGYGLEAFAGPETPGKPLPLVAGSFPRTFWWPVDQCSSQWAAGYFLRYQLRIHAEPVPDPSHRGNNDLVSSLKDSHMWESFLMMTVVWSVVYGPWNTSAWHSVLRTSALVFLDEHNHSEELFSSLLPWIARDRGEEDRLADPAYAKHVWDSLRDSKARVCNHVK